MGMEKQVDCGVNIVKGTNRAAGAVPQEAISRAVTDVTDLDGRGVDLIGALPAPDSSRP